MATPTLRPPYGVSSPYTVDDPGVLKNPFGLGTGGGGGTGPTGHGSTTTTAAPSASGGNWIFTLADTTAFSAVGLPIYCSDGTNSIRGHVVSVASSTQLTVAPDSTSGTVSSIANGSTFTFSGVAGASGANASVYVGVTTNSGNAYTATPSPAIASYVAGQLYTAQFNAANTGAATLNISGLGAKNLYKNNAALTGGEIVAGATIAVTYDGAQFQFTGDGGGGGGSSGITHGLDKDRPAPIANTVYIATDSELTYSSDGSKWYTSIGPDKVVVAGFNSNNFYQSRYSGTNVGPIFSNPYTLCFGFNVTALPGTANQVILCNSSGNGGWYIGNSTINANKLSIFQYGINTSIRTEFAGMSALTVGPHSAAISYNGSNLSLVIDGGSPVTVSVSGVYHQPTANDYFFIGTYFSPGYEAMYFGVSYVFGYPSVLSTTDMQTLTTNPGNYRPGSITTAPAYAWTAKSPWVFTQQRVWGSQVNALGNGNLICKGYMQFSEH